MIDPKIVHHALTLLDFTSLNDNDDETKIAHLCSRAVTPHGPVAAVCVWPRFVPLCKEWLWGTPVRVATVANFPQGRDSFTIALAETRAAVAYGADEVDLVFPYRAWLAGEHHKVYDLVSACRQVCGNTVLLKVILETGRLGEPQTIYRASLDAINAGADFLKTSTGKIDISATLPAAQAMLEAIATAERPVGCKISGGVRTVAEAIPYMELAERIMGKGWTRPGTFRFGASKLLDDLLAELAEETGL